MNLAPKYAGLLSPYPTVRSNGTLKQGWGLGQCQTCTTCKTKDCRDYRNQPKKGDVQHFICPFGLSVFVVRFESAGVTINGMYEPALNGDKRCPSRVKKSHRVNIDQVVEWRARTLRVVEEIAQDIDTGTKEAISSLHDIKTAVGLVYRNAEGMIQELPGSTFDEKAENAEANLKSLLKSVGLLSTRMSMASIVANPESVRFGQKRPMPIYKIFDKMCHLFEEPANRKRVGIRKSGYSDHKPPAYDSIESLALVLMDNAVKYCMQGEDIIVRVHDVMGENAAVVVEVESFGPLVPPEEQTAIFEKGYRSRQAKEAVAGGSGLGLYIAKLVAQAHGFEIQYRAAESEQGRRIGRNIFSFRIE